MTHARVSTLPEARAARTTVPATDVDAQSVHKRTVLGCGSGDSGNDEGKDEDLIRIKLKVVIVRKSIHVQCLCEWDRQCPD